MSIIDFFDDRVLNILYSFTQFGATIACFILYSVLKKSSLRQITFGYAINAIGLSLITLRNYIPAFITTWLGNSLMILGLFILYDGLVYMLLSKKRIERSIVFSVLFSVIHFYFSFINPNLELRIINFSIFSSLGAFYVFISSLIKVREKLNLIVLMFAITHVWHIVMNILRIVDTIQHNEITQLFSNISIFKYFILYSILLSIMRLTGIMLYHSNEINQLEQDLYLVGRKRSRFNVLISFSTLFKFLFDFYHFL